MVLSYDHGYKPNIRQNFFKLKSQLFWIFLHDNILLLIRKDNSMAKSVTSTEEGMYKPPEKEASCSSENLLYISGPNSIYLSFIIFVFLNFNVDTDFDIRR